MAAIWLSYLLNNGQCLTFSERFNFLNSGQTHEEFFSGRGVSVGRSHQRIVPDTDVAQGRVVPLAQGAQHMIAGQEVGQGEGDGTDTHDKDT